MAPWGCDFDESDRRDKKAALAHPAFELRTIAIANAVASEVILVLNISVAFIVLMPSR